MQGVRPSSVRVSAALAGLSLATILSTGARSEEPKLSISGYDPVAYFTDGRPVQGKAEIEYLWHKLSWRFASEAHREMFTKDPDHYAPQYDGYCAVGVAWNEPHKDTIDPNAWAIVDGKLYLTHTTRGLAAWQQNAEENIKRADVNWSTVEHQAEPVIVGPPCHDRPPSVVISFKEGGQQLLVGGQTAVDKDGNVVGKGDMRAQLEQVGKNIEACLKAAGAKVSDITQTQAYVTDAEAFSKSSDVLARYLGPASTPSNVAQVSLSAGPDFLVEIEVVANLDPAAAMSANRRP
jgi:enamine deaminase RidA (YjgF/YER057c/UK114 family)